MKISRLIVAVLPLAGPAVADDAQIVDPLDFMVRWPAMVGQEVLIKRGVVSLASDNFMIYRLPGGNVSLNPPWKDREDLRHLFQYCAGFVLTEDPRCVVAVSGTVGTMEIGGDPKLTGVDFYQPVK